MVGVSEVVDVKLQAVDAVETAVHQSLRDRLPSPSEDHTYILDKQVPIAIGPRKLATVGRVDILVH